MLWEPSSILTICKTEKKEGFKKKEKPNAIKTKGFFRIRTSRGTRFIKNMPLGKILSSRGENI